MRRIGLIIGAIGIAALTLLATNPQAQNQFWVLVNGALHYTGTVVVGGLQVGSSGTSKLSLSGANAGISFDGTTVSILSSDGGAYFQSAVGVNKINSSDLALATGGNPKFVFPAVSATDGQVQFTNGAKTTGVGVDVTTDGVLSIQNRAFNAAAQIKGIYVSTGSGMAVANVGANSCGTTAATIAGNNNAFVITVGATSGTQCRVAFTFAAASEWDCTVTDSTTTIATRATPIDTTHTDFLGAFVAGDKVTGICFPR